MSDLAFIQTEIAQLQALLDKAFQPFRAPPPVPTSCCGRGCNGCVWEGYYAAAAWWVEEARDAISNLEPLLLLQRAALT